MKALTIRLLLTLSVATLPTLLPAQAATSISTRTTVQVGSEAELDSLLAPVALYPDTVLTHVLIASTYPLDVVAAWRWQQQHKNYSEQQIDAAIAGYSWDPSVKALLLFSDVLGIMAQDLNWLQALGGHVIADQAYVLDRVQTLRSKAMRSGFLSNNTYQRVEHSHKTIVITSVQPHTIYVPFYDTRRVFGKWRHHTSPVYWAHPNHYRRTGSMYYSPGIRFSIAYDFGAIHWSKRYVVVNRKPIRRYYSPVKRVRSDDFQPWQYQQQRARKVIKTRPQNLRSKPGQRTVISQSAPRRQLAPLPGQVNARQYQVKASNQPVVIKNTKAVHHKKQRVQPGAGNKDSLRRVQPRQAPTRSKNHTTHRDGRTINR